MNRLADQVAVITQAQSELSAECARQFSDEGARLLLCSEDEKALEQLVSEIEENGGESAAFCSAIENEEQAAMAIEEALKNFGQIDIVVHNVGIDQKTESQDDLDGTKRSAKLEALLKSAHLLSAAAVKEMKDSEHPSILSLAPFFSPKDPAYAAYVKTLARLVALCRDQQLRTDCPQIRINAVFPGNAALPMPALLTPETLAVQTLEAMDVYDDLPEPDFEDLANIALFLASEESKAINGQAIVADYGASIN